jgi:hypothetical protein
MGTSISIWLSLSIFLFAANSFAETLDFGAVILEKNNGEIREADPIAVNKGPHHYKWADMKYPDLYRDHDLYRSMADAKFWKGGHSRKGVVEEKKRKITAVDNRILSYVSIQELSEMFEPGCLDKVVPEINLIKEMLKKSNLPSAAIVFRSKGGTATKYESSKERILASVHLDCKSSKTREVAQSNRPNIQDSDRSVLRGDVSAASKALKKPGAAAKSQ